MENMICNVLSSVRLIKVACQSRFWSYTRNKLVMKFQFENLNSGSSTSKLQRWLKQNSVFNINVVWHANL